MRRQKPAPKSEITLAPKQLMTHSIHSYSDHYVTEVEHFIKDILEGEFGLTGVDRPDLSSIKKTYQKGKGNFWIALEDGLVIGTIALVDYGNGRGYLKRMYVSRKNRGSDLAKDLLRTLITYAKTQGFMAIYIGTVPEMVAANKFYAKEGFARIEKLPDDLPTFGDTIFYKKEIY